MIKVEFDYKSSKISIQATNEEKMREICHRFLLKSQANIDNIIFIYYGTLINLDSSICQIINEFDKERKIMSILAVDNNIEKENKSIIRSPYIICPICKETSRFEVKDYKINIFNCKNGHKTNNLLLSEFENTQFVDESKIICDKCKINKKSNTFDKMMYICNKCNMNLCPLCKESHDNSHKIINYSQKFFVCNKHNKEYNSYCKECKQDLCLYCEKEHKQHNKILYSEIIEEIREEINLIEIKLFIKSSLDAFNSIIKSVRDKLNNILKNAEIYSKIIESNFSNYNIFKINYNILQNLKYNLNSMRLETNDILKDCSEIIRDSTYKEFIHNIFKMYNCLNKNEIELLYNIPKNEKQIKIFGEAFIEKNKDLCKIIHNNTEYNLTSNFNCSNIKENILKIKLRGINNVAFLDSMFEGCSTLSHLSDFSNLDTTYIISMNNLFKNSKCPKLPNISGFKTNNVHKMEGLFQGCSLLESLPDISNWDTSNVSKMNSMFSGCSSLKSLPDISNWDITLALSSNGMEKMFVDCPKSLIIPKKFKSE